MNAYNKEKYIKKYISPISKFFRENLCQKKQS